MKLTEDDRYIFDRYELGYHAVFLWMWDCPECGDFADFFHDREQAIASARRHDEMAHR